MRLVVVLIAFGLCSLSVSAHRTHFGWTDIQLNGERIEFVHRFHEHDAAQMVTKLGNKNADIRSLETQARFALYVAEHFAFGFDQANLELELLGAELDGKYILVYQELTWPEARPREISVYANMLMDLYPDQIHLVNLSFGGTKATLEFSDRDQIKRVDLQHADPH